MIFVNSSGGRIGRIFWTNSNTALVNMATTERTIEFLVAPHSRWGCVTWDCLRFCYEQYEGPIFPSIVSRVARLSASDLVDNIIETQIQIAHDHHSC